MSDYSLPRIKESELPEATSIDKVRVLDNAGKSVWKKKEDLPITEAQVTGLTAALALKADRTELAIKADQTELDQLAGEVASATEELFEVKKYTADRSQETFNTYIAVDWYTERDNWFDQKARKLSKLSIKTGAAGTLEVGIFTINETAATKVSQKTVSCVAGVNTYALADIMDDTSILVPGTKYYVFIKGAAAVKIGYASLTNGSYHILVSNETALLSSNFKLSFWLTVNEPFMLSPDETTEVRDKLPIISVINDAIFTDKIHPFGRDADTFSSFVTGPQWYTEKDNWFDQKTRLFDGLKLRAYSVDTIKVAIFTISGTTSTKVSEKTINTAVGINTYSLADVVTDVNLIIPGTMYYLFLQDTAVNTTIGYSALTGGAYFINVSDEAILLTANFKFSFWLVTKESTMLDETEYGSLMGVAVTTFNLADELAKKDVVRVPPGTYIISTTINVPSGKRIIGVPGKSILQADANVLKVLAIDGKTDVEISGITVKGVYQNTVLDGAMVAAGVIDTFDAAILETGAGTKIGIYINASERINIHGCRISNFDKYGIQTILSGKTYEYGIKLTDNYIHDCYLGLKLQQEAEYSTYVGNTISKCQIGLYVNSGNNAFSNNHIDKNRVGLVMGNGLNDAHGSFVGCSFNHNSLYGIALNLLSVGETFTGCNIWYAPIYIKSSRGVILDSCLIGNSAIYADGNHPSGGVWMICNSMFLGGSSVAHDYNGNTSNVKLKNNWWMNGTDSGTINN